MAHIVKLPHVLLEVEVPAKTFLAHLAREGLCLLVGVHVKSEVIRLVERLMAEFTFMGFGVTMGEEMVLVVPFLVEAFLADVTCEGLDALVDPGVRVER